MRFVSPAVVWRTLQFPEHSFYNLRDKILLFRHDTFDPNVLRLITSAKDIFDGTLVEVVLSGETLSTLFASLNFCVCIMCDSMLYRKLDVNLIIR